MDLGVPYVCRVLRERGVQPQPTEATQNGAQPYNLDLGIVKFAGAHIFIMEKNYLITLYDGRKMRA